MLLVPSQRVIVHSNMPFLRHLRQIGKEYLRWVTVVITPTPGDSIEGFSRLQILT
ncbi:ORF136 [White spot syndrome virus]|uniref:ORF136 n=1 Tax=White spot syndrome virus TaxID=342409 RepID=K7WJY9_9VIRU|nr:ORF136 [White spot syndrome virus]AYW76590.1 hypothetical protein [Procambarus clarkii virus]AFX59655.1 ORF136 [White spot syndrome virus]ALZ45787.1 SpoIIIAH-like protein [White spot syndrome virus]ASV62872.1 SpoIIIAH-like protein [White spot syndrome virus]